MIEFLIFLFLEKPAKFTYKNNKEIHRIFGSLNYTAVNPVLEKGNHSITTSIS